MIWAILRDASLPFILGLVLGFLIMIVAACTVPVQFPEMVMIDRECPVCECECMCEQLFPNGKWHDGSVF